MAERLLMIEDDAALAQLVRDYLGPLGFSVSSVGTAAEGLRRLEAELVEQQLELLAAALDVAYVDVPHARDSLSSSAARGESQTASRADLFRQLCVAEPRNTPGGLM